MRLGIVSDTHDNVPAVVAAVSLFEREAVDAIVHCGDFIAPPVVPFFDGHELHGVLGNNDGEVDGLTAAFESLGNGSTLHGRSATLTFDDRRFAVLHGEDLSEVSRLAESGDYDFVCYGHHHEAVVREVGDTTVINPGAHFPTVPDEHRTVAVVDLDADAVRLERIAP